MPSWAGLDRSSGRRDASPGITFSTPARSDGGRGAPGSGSPVMLSADRWSRVLGVVEAGRSTGRCTGPAPDVTPDVVPDPAPDADTGVPPDFLRGTSGAHPVRANGRTLFSRTTFDAARWRSTPA